MTSNSPAVVPVRAWLETARRALIHEPDAGLEAQLLLAHALGQPRSWLLAHPESVIGAEPLARVEALLARRIHGEPLPYLLGHWEFYGLDFAVTPDVLIPRPETELLVDKAISWLAARPAQRAADVGTGSGCIAVTLAKYVPGLRILAVDRSMPALRVARQNAARHGAGGQIRFWQGDLLTALAGPLDFVCANLPYIPVQGLQQLPVAQHEPWTALEGGPDGLRWIRALLADAPRWLAPGGRMLLEMQFDQGEAISALARQHLPYASVRILLDLAGLPRVVDIQCPEE